MELNYGFLAILALFVLAIAARIVWHDRVMKRRIAEADERTRVRNEAYKAREAERHMRASAFAGRASPLAGLGGGSQPQVSYEADRRKRDEENEAMNRRYQTAAPYNASNWPSPDTSYASLASMTNSAYVPDLSHSFGGGGSFDGGGASGDWGSSSSSSDSCSSSSSDSSSSSSDSGSCSSSSD